MRLKSQLGMTIVEVVIATGIALAGFAALTKLTVNGIQQRKKIEIKTSMSQVVNNLRAAITNDTSWANSINATANDSALGCLRESNPTGCDDGPSGNGGPFALYDVAGNLLYDGKYADMYDMLSFKPHESI